MKLVSVAQMREIEQKAREDFGIPDLLLMENAGRAVAEAVREHLRGKARVSVLGGMGNNGGDGWVAARHLANAGVTVHPILLGEREKVQGTAGTNLNILERMGYPPRQFNPEEDLAGLSAALAESALAVDAILGTGTRGTVGEWLGEAIIRTNASRLPVVAVDVPSGLCADTGRVLGQAIRANTTVTMGLPKPGLYTGEGPEWAGQVVVADISLPAGAVERTHGPWELLDVDMVRNFPPPLTRAQHKGDRGTLLLLAGSRNMTGAAILAARAACRAGAGKVHLGLPQTCQAQVAPAIPNCLTWGLPDTGEGFLAPSALDQILPALDKFDAVAVGPGLSTASGVFRLVRGLLRVFCKPLLLDADALNVLAEKEASLVEAAGPVIITPHPGEMSRLTGRPSREIQANRPGIALAAAGKWQVWVVLKGAGTVIATPDGKGYINPTGNPGMASAGTGDVLTGLMGGLLAQGARPLPAAAAAVYLHGMAGDLAAAKFAQPSLTAEDLIAYIPDCFRQI